MKVLSLFDGISCARVALERCGYKDITYFASEIDKYAIQIAQKNYPNTKQIGSVVDIASCPAVPSDFTVLDLLIGGSPCQDLSIAKKDRQGLKGSRSGLFYEYVRILNELKPRFFVLENVNSMPKEAKEQISEILGVQPVMINAALVSAQNRKRLFWVGKKVGDTYERVEIPQPEDRGILLKDILEDGSCDRLKSYCIDANYFKGGSVKNYLDNARRQVVMRQSETRLMVRVGKINKGGQGNRIYSEEGKSVALSALGGGQGAKTGLYAIPVALRNRGEGKKPEYNGTDKSNSLTTVQTDSMVESQMQIRKLTPIECERLQGLPDNYTEGVSNTQRYKALGNAFNVDVVAHILKHLFSPQQGNGI